MKRVLIFVIVLMGTGVQLFAQITNPEVTIRFYNKKIYSLDSTIQLLVELENTTENPIAFFLADNKVYNIKLKVSNLKGQLCEPSDYYLKAMALKEPYQYKEVVLQPRESYSFRLALKDYVILEEAIPYELQLYFYGGLAQNPGEAATSNVLYMNINTKEEVQQRTVASEQPLVKTALKKEKMTPDQVVSYINDAMMKKNWDEFFLYLDLESLFLKNSERKRIYLSQSEETRTAILNEYKVKMTEGDVEKEFILIPSRYEIILTTYNNTNAEVTMIKYFNRVSFTEKKEYKYRLEKQDNFWMINDYAVRNLGIEK